MRQALAFLLAIGVSGQALADVATDRLRQLSCSGLSSRVAGMPGGQPVLLRSYDDRSGVGALAEPSLRTAAFVYDNALAIIALVACADRPHAERLGVALSLAIHRDARLRNVYRSGPIDAEGPLSNGWWNEAEKRWNEDAYQQGTATGNVAWAALAMLTLADGNSDPRWRPAAEKLARWIATQAAVSDGYLGGVHGFDDAPRKLTWASTEHNVDAAAVFGWLARKSSDRAWQKGEQNARRFTARQWQPSNGHFLIGELPDGAGPNRSGSGIDAQLWPLLLTSAPPQWRRSIDFVLREHAVDGGFDYNNDRDGLWTEGTAQAALVFRLDGRAADSARALARISPLVSGGGYFYATSADRISTRLAIGPDSSGADFHYYRWPHLGATAWVALAATGWNPLTGIPASASPNVDRP